MSNLSEKINDTIAAIATPPGNGAIGIVRISGENTRNILQQVFRPTGQTVDFKENIQPRYLYLGHVYEQNIKIDQALAVLMIAPHSYTGEDVAEIQCHGGKVSIETVLKTVIAAGARLAQPGEFSFRAFLNGKLDLVQAEAIVDLINAKTSSGLSLAVNQLSGNLSQVLYEITDDILQLISAIEVGVDFPDDEDALQAAEVIEKSEKILQKITDLLQNANEGRIYREGFQTVLLGRPNVGKSSILNLLAGEERAIVTNEPGTTRDAIEEYLNIDGIPLLLIDTAGLREGENEAERIGVNTSRNKAAAASLLLLVIEAKDTLDPADAEVLAEYHNQQGIIIINKADLNDADILAQDLAAKYPSFQIAVISAKEKIGIDNLKQMIKHLVQGNHMDQGRDTLLSNVRHIEALIKAKQAIIEALHTLNDGMPIDLASIDLISAWQCLGEITGNTASENLIDNIFANFCLGK